MSLRIINNLLKKYFKKCNHVWIKSKHDFDGVNSGVLEITEICEKCNLKYIEYYFYCKY